MCTGSEHHAVAAELGHPHDDRPLVVMKQPFERRATPAQHPIHARAQRQAKRPRRTHLLG